jgi:hypothetical protein
MDNRHDMEANKAIDLYNETVDGYEKQLTQCLTDSEKKSEGRAIFT